MSFDAYKRVRDSVKAALLSDFPTHLAAVATEHSITLPSLKKVLRHTNSRPDAFPVAVVGTVYGEVDDEGGLKTDAQVTVMLIVSGSDPDKMDAQMDGYVTAVVRTFARLTRDCITYNVVAFNADEPAPYDGELLQTCGVRLRCRLGESPA